MHIKLLNSLEQGRIQTNFFFLTVAFLGHWLYKTPTHVEKGVPFACL